MNHHALVCIHWLDRATFAELPYAARVGSVWLLDLQVVRVTATGRVERLGRPA